MGGVESFPQGGLAGVLLGLSGISRREIPDSSPDAPDWLAANVVVQLAIDLAILWWFGPRPLVYLALSLSFAFGFHPLGAG